MSTSTVALTIEMPSLDASLSWNALESLVVGMSHEVPARALALALDDAQERLLQEACGPRWAPVRGRLAPFACPGCGAREDFARKGKRTRPRKLHSAAGTVELILWHVGCRGCGRNFAPLAGQPEDHQQRREVTPAAAAPHVPQDQLDRPGGGVQLARPGPLPLAGEVLMGPAPRARERREQAPHRRPPRPARLLQQPLLRVVQGQRQRPGRHLVRHAHHQRLQRVPRLGRIERGHLDRQGDSTGGHRRRLLALDGGSPAVLQDQGPSSTERHATEGSLKVCRDPTCAGDRGPHTLVGRSSRRPVYVGSARARRRPAVLAAGCRPGLGQAAAWAAQRTVRTSSTAAWTAFSTWALVAAASVIGFGGHELVARYRIRVGRRIGSAALIADGRHARTDGLTSLVVLIGAGGSPSGSAWPTRSSAWSQPSPPSPCSAKLPGRSSPGSWTPSTRHSSTGWRRSLGPPRASSTLARCGCGGSAMPCGPCATSSSTSTCRWCKPTDRRRDRAPAPHAGDPITHHELSAPTGLRPAEPPRTRTTLHACRLRRRARPGLG